MVNPSKGPCAKSKSVNQRPPTLSLHCFQPPGHEKKKIDIVTILYDAPGNSSIGLCEPGRTNNATLGYSCGSSALEQALTASDCRF